METVFPVFAFQTRAVLSRDAVTINEPSGEKVAGVQSIHVSNQLK